MVPGPHIDPVVVEPEVVQEPTGPLVGGVWVRPNLKPELQFIGVLDSYDGREGEVALHPSAEGRGSEDRDRGCSGAVGSRGVCRHGARIAAFRLDVGPVAPIPLGLESVLHPSPVAPAGGVAVQVVPMVELEEVPVDVLRVRN